MCGGMIRIRNRIGRGRRCQNAVHLVLLGMANCMLKTRPLRKKQGESKHGNRNSVCCCAYRLQCH